MKKTKTTTPLQGQIGPALDNLSALITAHEAAPESPIALNAVDFESIKIVVAFAQQVRAARMKGGSSVQGKNKVEAGRKGGKAPHRVKPGRKPKDRENAQPTS